MIEEKKNKKIFIYYCKDCETHLTESALEAKSNFYNDSGLIKKHETHELINLLNIKKVIEKGKKILKKYRMIMMKIKYYLKI